MSTPRPGIGPLLPILLALGASGAAPPGMASPPPRPGLQDRLLVLRSHPRPPLRVEPPPRPASGQDDFDVTNYEITLVPSPLQRKIEGTVAVTFTPAAGVPEVRELVLDLAEGMMMAPWAVTRRSVPAIALPYVREGDVLRIDLAAGGGALLQGRTDTVTVRYSGYPSQAGESGLRFGLFGRFPVQIPSMYSLSQPHLARTWWPCKDRPDDKATVTMRIDAPVHWEAVSNGRLVGITAGSRDGNQRTEWRETVPIPTYLVAVALSEYDTCEAEYVSPLNPAVTTPLTYWAWPSRIADACARWQRTPEIMAAFAERFGEYPFASEKYDHVAVSPMPGQDPYIAMENATCSFFGSGWLSLSHETLMAHELAHHWWGNSVTPRSFESIWLSEGFATYAEALWWESQHGAAEYRAYLQDLDPLRTLGEFEGPVDRPLDADGDGWPDGDADGAELTVYYKGAWVLHMLRWVLGQQDQGASVEPMAALLRQWGQAHGRGVASTADFVSVANARAAESGLRDGLDWFFEQWLQRTDRPCYRVGWTSVPGMDGGWTVQLVVEQAKWGLDETTGAMTCADELPRPYRMPVRVVLHGEDGERRALTVESNQRVQSWRLPTPVRPTAVSWDPDGWILKGVQAVDVDADADGWADPFDSCPLVPDPDQADLDRDGLGDACQDGRDFDGDGRPNEADCAPADAGAWSGVERLPPIALFVAKDAEGLLVWHDMPRADVEERPYTVNLVQGPLDGLMSRGGLTGAQCFQEGRTGSGDVLIPWSELTGSRFIVPLPFNGCGRVDASGRNEDPCR